MSEHPIQGLMSTAMGNIKEMVDVNTIVGDPIVTADGTTILPVSKVSFGFASGGSDFPAKTQTPTTPFGGGSGAGITITPIAFLVVGNGTVRMLQITEGAGSVEKLVDMVPEVIDKVSSMFAKKKAEKETSENA